MSNEYQSAVIFVKDLAASRHFYEDLLDQEVDIDFGTNLSFAGGFSLWVVDHAFEMIYEHAPDGTDRLGHRNFELYFESADIETVAERLSEAGVPFVHPLREHPWGQRAFRVYDPDGHIVELGERMTEVIIRLLGQGLSAEAVARQTGMPLAMVEQTASE